MRHPPPTAADNQFSRDRITDDRLGYNLQNKYRPFDEVCEDSSGGGEGTESNNVSNNNVAISDTNTPQRRMSENHHHHHHHHQRTENLTLIFLWSYYSLVYPHYLQHYQPY
jgi:hypothetical protein